MEFSPTKCTVMRVMPNKTKKALQTIYVPHTQALSTTDDSKYLGVSFANNLTWSKYVSITAGKGNKCLVFCEGTRVTATPKLEQLPTPP